MTNKVNGKMGILTPCRSETTENFITKIGHFDYVVRCNTQAKFCENQPWCIRPTNSWNMIEVHRIWFWFRIRPDTNMLGSGKIRIRPDSKSLDPVNRIHYHVVVPITVSMHCVLSPNVRKV